MIATAGFSQAAPVAAKLITEMSDPEFDAYIAAERAKVTFAYLERAISYREASRGYHLTARQRAQARQFMRENALQWKARRNAEVRA